MAKLTLALVIRKLRNSGPDRRPGLSPFLVVGVSQLSLAISCMIGRLRTILDDQMMSAGPEFPV